MRGRDLAFLSILAYHEASANPLVERAPPRCGAAITPLVNIIKQDPSVTPYCLSWLDIQTKTVRFTKTIYAKTVTVTPTGAPAVSTTTVAPSVRRRQDDSNSSDFDETCYQTFLDGADAYFSTQMSSACSCLTLSTPSVTTTVIKRVGQTAFVTATPTASLTTSLSSSASSSSTPASSQTPSSTPSFPGTTSSTTTSSPSSSTPSSTTSSFTSFTPYPQTTSPPSSTITPQIFPTLGCTAGTAYTSGTRVFNYCTSLYAYGYSITGAASPYPTDAAGCVGRCTASCVAANWAGGANACQLGYNDVYRASVFSTWNPLWTAYVLSTTVAASTSTPSPQPTTTSTPVFSSPPSSNTTFSTSTSTSTSTGPVVFQTTAASCIPNSSYQDYTRCPGDGRSQYCGCYSSFANPSQAYCNYGFDYSKPCHADTDCRQYGPSWWFCSTANFTGTPGTGYCSNMDPSDWYGSRNVACAAGR